MTTLHPAVLIILDGWGYRADEQYNAIAAAKLPFWHHLWQHYPHTLLAGSGHAVGLPQDQMGNSEVGHLTIGAGRTVYQEFTRIDKAIEDSEFFHNPALLAAVRQVKQTNKALHILGLLSPGGVHSHERHIHAMAQLAAQEEVEKVYVHAFLDGRDTPPKSAMNSLISLDKDLKRFAHGKIASIVGRYYAMDRDKRWERTEQAYELLTTGNAQYQAATAELGLAMAYERGETDEFVKATVIHEPGAKPVIIEDGDVIVFINYRADRARQLTHAFIDQDFKGFTRKIQPKIADFVSLTQYAADLKTTVAFAPQTLNNVLGQYIANNGLKQLRIAETEKYAHVTFFLNGGMETPFKDEDRILVPSPKVATYDLQPQMSALEITDQLIAAINSKKYALIVCNFANPDMLGHTGDMAATIHAVEVIDDCLKKVVTAAQSQGSEVIITADHGNAECMFDERTQQPHTAHTSEPVPFIYIGRPAQILENNGTLADVAPTLLTVMGLTVPEEMTGKVVIKIM